MLGQDLSSDGNGVLGGGGTIGPNLQGQLIEVGHIANTGVFHRIVDLIDRGIQGVHRNHTNGSLRSLVSISGHIATATAQGDFHVQGCIRAERADMQILVQNLYFVIDLDISGGDFALTGGIDIHGLNCVTVQLADQSLDIQDDLRNILFHTGNGGELMLDTGNLDRGCGSAGQRGQENSPQRITKRGTVAPFQRLYIEYAMRQIFGRVNTLDTRLVNFYHIINTLLIEF
jgi:hypothetical protein